MSGGGGHYRELVSLRDIVACEDVTSAEHKAQIDAIFAATTQVASRNQIRARKKAPKARVPVTAESETGEAVVVAHIENHALDDVCAESTGFLGFAERSKVLRVNKSFVSEQITPHGVKKFALRDIRVSTRGPDDAVFANNEEIRQRVARGNTVVSYRDVDGTEVAFGAVQGLFKFTGGIGDDDDVDDPAADLVWKKFFLRPIEDATTVISMFKANGEAAHVACINVLGARILLCGSKNVHIAVRTIDDVATYEDRRYSVAVEVARKTFELLDEIGADNAARLLDFLCATGLTANFEILQPNSQHVELLPSEPKMLFFSFTRPNFSGVRHTLCEVHPVLAVHLMQHVGVDTVHYETIPFAQFDEHVQAVRESSHQEGRVMYVLGSDGQVIGLIKKKTVWYVVVRAIREKIKFAVKKTTGSGMSRDEVIEDATKRTERRLAQIQQWLQFSDRVLEEYTELARAFIAWVLAPKHLVVQTAVDVERARIARQAEKESRTKEEIRVEHEEHVAMINETKRVTVLDINTLFPVVWNAFLQDAGLSDDVNLQ